MKRILVFDSACALCTGIARKVCNEAGELIHDVWSLADVRARGILTAAGMANLAKPALIEITPERTTVFAGPRFRWQMLRILGPQRAMRLAKVIAGDLASLSLSQKPTAQLRANGIQIGEGNLAPAVGRRKLLGMMSSLVAGFAFISGLGFSKIARSATKGQMGRSRDSVEPFWYDWVMKLEGATAEPKIVVGTERELRWKRFLSLEGLQRLVASRGFEALPGALDIHEALLSEGVPRDMQEVTELVAGGTTIQAGDPMTRFGFITRQTSLPDGGVLNTDILTTGNLMIHTLEHCNGERTVRAGLKLYEIRDAARDWEVHASMNRRGGFRFKSARIARAESSNGGAE